MEAGQSDPISTLGRRSRAGLKRRAQDKSSAFVERASYAQLTESQRHAWSALHVLWQERKREGGLDEAEAGKIDAIFYAGRETPDYQYGWERLNDTELRVGALLSPEQIKTQYFVLLTAAARRFLPNIADYQGRVTLFEQDSIVEQRAIYMALLSALQRDFIEKRLLRTLRVSVADRMFRYGVLATTMPILVQIVCVVFVWLSTIFYPFKVFYVSQWENVISFALVSALGMLGAYFSRMISFQKTIANLTFESATNEYLGKILRLRMLYGMIGAIIFFLILRSEVFTSDLLPQFDVSEPPIDLHERGVLFLLIPSANLAKIIICAFLAGFSERLVPDALARIEQRSIASHR